MVSKRDLSSMAEGMVANWDWGVGLGFGERFLSLANGRFVEREKCRWELEVSIRENELFFYRRICVMRQMRNRGIRIEGHRHRGNFMAGCCPSSVLR